MTSAHFESIFERVIPPHMQLNIGLYSLIQKIKILGLKA